MLGEKLKKLRGNRTQDEIAKAIGISRSRYSHYENDIRQPDLETLEQLADFFNVTTDWLLGRTDEAKPGIHTIPKSIGYQLLILLKIANDLKQNKEIQTNDSLKKMMDIMGDIRKLPGLIDNEKLPKLDDYELLKVLCGPNAVYDFEEELGYDLVDKNILKDESDYFIYICGDGSMSPEFNDSDRLLIKVMASINECSDKDVVIFKHNNEYLIRRFYRNDNHVVLQANNSEFPPIILSNDEFSVLGNVSSILIHAE